MKVTTTTNSVRNPYLDAQAAKSEAIKAVKRLTKLFGELTKVSRKQIYLVNCDNPFYIWILSAPSNVQFSTIMKSVSKEYGKYPMYVLFTRDVNTYPNASGKTYWDKVKSLYKKSIRNFYGAIMGLNELNTDVALSMEFNTKLKLDFNRYIQLTNGNVTMEQVLKELAGLTQKKLKAIIPIIELIK